MRKILRRGVIITLIFVLAGTAVFGALTRFQPLKDRSYVTVKNVRTNAFISRGRGQFTANSNVMAASGAIYPKDEDYILQVRSTKNSRSSKTAGAIMSNANVKKTAKEYQNDTWANNYYWFNMSRNPGGITKPKVTYTGYRIWDPNTGKYVNLKIIYEIVDWNRKYNSKNIKKGNPEKNFRAVIGIGKTFKGMPDVELCNIGAAAVKVTFQNAATGNAYNFKYSVTYKDIDAYQGVGIKSDRSGGFTVLNAAAGNLNYSHDYQGYNVISSNSAKERDGEAREYKTSYNVDVKSGTVNWIYVSNQKTKNDKMGVPNGRYAHFGAARYSDGEPILPVSAPDKYVIDENPDNDIDDYTHNVVTGRKKAVADNEFFYDIDVTVPPGMSSDPASYAHWSSFSFFDNIDQCIKVDSDYSWSGKAVNRLSSTWFDGQKPITTKHQGWRVVAYSYADDKYRDVTNAFRFSQSGTKCTWSLQSKKTSDLNKIYCSGEGSELELIIPCHFQADQDSMISHHGLVSGKFIDVPNKASVTMKYDKAKKSITRYTNSIFSGTGWSTRTRIKKTFRKNLIIRKVVDGVNPKADDTFKFTVSSGNNTGSYNWSITGGGENRSGTYKASKKGTTFALKANQILTIRDIPAGVRFAVKETGTKAYKASFEKKANGASGKTSGSAGVARALSFEGTMQENDADARYEVKNTHVPYKHKLILTKKVIGTTSATFTVRVNFYGGFVDVGELTTSVSGGGTPSVNTSSKQITFTGVRNGSVLTVGGIPDDAKFIVKEEAAAGVKPAYTATAGEDVLNKRSGTASRGESITTGAATRDSGKETFVPGGIGSARRYRLNYNIAYTIKNNVVGKHNVTVSKKSTGNKANKNDEFKYTALFENIPEEDGERARFAYSIKEGSTIISEGKAKALDSASYSQAFTLKSGQSIIFYQVSQGTKLTVTEKKNDYRPTVKYTNSAGNDTAAQGEKHKDLAVSSTLPAGDQAFRFEFTNVLDDSPNYHEVVVSKTVRGGAASTGDSFAFSAKFTGIPLNTSNTRQKFAADVKQGDTVIRTIRTSGIRDSSYTETFALKSGQHIVFHKVPKNVTVTVTENANTLKYMPKVDHQAADGSGRSKTAGRGQALSAAVTLPDNTKQFTFAYTNTKEPEIRYHDVTVSKRVSGSAADTNDEFSYKAEFSSIPVPASGSRQKFAAQIRQGTAVLRSIAADNISGSAYTQTFTLKHGQQITFSNVPANVKVTVTEAANTKAYTPQVTYTTAAGTESSKSGGEGQALSAGVTLPDNTSAFTFAYVNTKVPDPPPAQYHTVVVSKEAEGNSADPDDAFTFNAEFSNIPAPVSGSRKKFAAQIKQGSTVIRSIAAADISGSAYTQSFTLKSGQQLVFPEVPGTVNVRVTEAANTKDYIPEVAYTKADGSVAVEAGAENTALSAEVSLPQITDGKGKLYRFDFRNEKNVEVPFCHNVAVTKEVAGNRADPDDVFSFTAEFSNIPEPAEGGRKTFAAETEGAGAVTGRIEPEALSGTAYTQEFTLKDGQQITFLDLPESVKVKVTEAATGYVPRVDYQTAAGEPAVAEGAKNTALSAELTLPHATSEGSRYSFNFTNTKDGPQDRSDSTFANSLKVGKIATDGTREPFDFTVDLKGLAEGTWYSAASSRGDTMYRMVMDETGLYALDTSTNRKVKGMAFTLKRADGKTQAFLANEDGFIPKEEYEDWAGIFSGGLDVIWAGGLHKAPVYKYAVFNEQEGSLTFMESSVRYENGYDDGENVFYSGFEELTGNTPPLWSEHLEEILSVHFRTEVSPKTLYSAFACPYLESISGISLLHTGEATTMQRMFAGAERLESVDVSALDTGNVTDMSNMFRGCGSLVTLDTLGFDTSKVTDMSDMFGGCESLAHILVSDRRIAEEVTAGTGMIIDIPEAQEAPLCFRDPPAYEEPEVSTDVFRGTITPFVSGEDGTAQVPLQNADGDTVVIDGLPTGSSYTVTEAGNTYVPSYAWYRNDSRLAGVPGQKNMALSTRETVFDGNSRTEDLMEYVNNKNSFNLKVTKVTMGDPDKKFDFTINLSGLYEQEYSVRLPGEKTSSIAMDDGGNITLSVVTGSAAGIPVKLIRPDGNTKTMHTDTEGRISRSEFGSWLSAGQTESFTFTVQWPGGETEGTFEVDE